jgi:hypothetical protein
MGSIMTFYITGDHLRNRLGGEVRNAQPQSPYNEQHAHDNEKDRN